MHSPTHSNRLPAQYERLNVPHLAAGIVNDGYESSNPSLNMSRSWTGLSAEVNQNPGGAMPGAGPLPHHANSMGHLRVPGAGGPLTRANRKSSGGGGAASAAAASYRNRVSQV
uniref:Uncharacterized protein n=1 Tax=Caenorhabditis japonica TaxID=281687 RepID=A0A8R1EFV7_CAEJA